MISISKFYGFIFCLLLGLLFSLISATGAEAIRYSCRIPDKNCVELVNENEGDAWIECSDICPDSISGGCGMYEESCKNFSCETPDLGCVDLVSFVDSKARLECDNLCSDPALVGMCNFKYQFCLNPATYNFWIKDKSGKLVCKELFAQNIIGAKRLLREHTSLTYDGVSIKNMDDLVRVTKLTEGKCPSGSMQQDTYHCFVISSVGKFKAGDCREMQATSQIDAARNEAVNLCASNKAEADSMLYKTDIGPCPSAPSAGKSAKDLLATAARELNPARINQPTDLIGKAIKLLMAFMGSISLVLYVWAGILWLSASGASERVDKAKKILVWTTLGVVVMLGSYMLVSFVFKSLGL